MNQCIYDTDAGFFRTFGKLRTLLHCRIMSIVIHDPAHRLLLELWLFACLFEGGSSRATTWSRSIRVIALALSPKNNDLASSIAGLWGRRRTRPGGGPLANPTMGRMR